MTAATVTGTTPVAVAASTPTISTNNGTPVARAATDTSASVVVTASRNVRKEIDKAFATPAAKKRKAKTTTKRFEAYEDVTDLIEFPCPDGTVERRVGSLVRVAKRTFSDSNKLGGVGKVTARNGTREANNLSYDVAYVLGGVETDIHYAYVVLDDAFCYTTNYSKEAPGFSYGQQQ